MPPSDPGTIILGWFVVPGSLAVLLGSVVSAFWNHRAGKELRALESRLRKQEETYRIAQSPRVEVAVELWTALREYERTLVALMHPIQYVKISPGASLNGPGDMDRLSDEHLRTQRSELQRNWAALAKARDKAEVILPPNTFKPFDEMFLAYFGAYDSEKTMSFPGLTVESTQTWRAKRDKYLQEASRLHPSALLALQLLMGPDVK